MSCGNEPACAHNLTRFLLHADTIFFAILDPGLSITELTAQTLTDFADA